MKSLAELAAIREKMQSKVVIREGMGSVRVVVGMATCGIAAGARPVLKAFTDGVSENALTDKVTVTITENKNHNMYTDKYILVPEHIVNAEKVYEWSGILSDAEKAEQIKLYK